MILIISIFIALTFFFVLNYLLNFLSQIKFESKVYNAVQKQNKNKSFLAPSIFRRADILGGHLEKIKFQKFKNYAGNLAALLKFSGKKYERFNVYQIIALQCFCGFAGCVLCLIFISTNFILVLLCGAGGFFLLYLHIKEEVNNRKNLILKQLPDAADLLSAMLGAGLDFFGALEKTAGILKGPFSDELVSMSAKISLGYDKKTALMEMAQNCGVEQVVFFAKTVNMSLESGSGMADTLRRLAGQIRKEREMNAEKKAQEAPVKILIPLVLFIFPTIFIVIFGPIVINLMQTGGF
jgi:tight adherence protein C